MWLGVVRFINVPNSQFFSLLSPPSFFSLFPEKIYLRDYPIYGRILNFGAER